MKKDSKKGKRGLFTPAVLLFLASAVCVLAYGAVRYFMLAPKGAFSLQALYQVLFETVPALAVLLIVSVGLFIVLAVRVKRPVRGLTGQASSLAERAEAGETVKTPSASGCLSTLSEAVAEESKRVVALLGRERQRTAEETERKVRLAIARDVYAETVPGVSFDALTYGVAARAIAGEDVGADFCDAFPVDRTHIFLAIGDVWGKGLPASLFAARIKSELRRCIAAGMPLAETLVAVNGALLGNRDRLLATLFIAVFNPETGELRYADAGHFAPVVSGGQTGFLLHSDVGTPIGLYPDFSARECSYPMRPGQGLLLYTDGIVHARDGSGAIFGFDRLLKSTKTLFDDALSADYIAEGILGAASEFCKEREDDLAAVALYYPIGLHRLFRPELSETETMKTLLLEWLSDDPRKKKIVLVCEEIFTNIVRHAGAKSIQMSCVKEENRLILRFTDDGEPFDPLSSKEAGNPYDLGGGGMGMAIIRQISGEMFYRTKENLNVLTVRFPLIRGF